MGNKRIHTQIGLYGIKKLLQKKKRNNQATENFISQNAECLFSIYSPTIYFTKD